MCERDFSAESMMFPNLKQKDPITQANMKLSGKSKPEFSIFFSHSLVTLNQIHRDHY